MGVRKSADPCYLTLSIQKKFIKVNVKKIYTVLLYVIYIIKGKITWSSCLR